VQPGSQGVVETGFDSPILPRSPNSLVTTWCLQPP